MSSRSAALAFVATLVAFIALDMAWLNLVAVKMFQDQIGRLLRPEPIFPAAAVFYLIYASALTALAVAPAVQERSMAGAIWRGALLGLAAYATFNLTNFAILKGWSLDASLKDMTWGTVGSALATVVGYWAGARGGPAAR